MIKIKSRLKTLNFLKTFYCVSVSIWLTNNVLIVPGELQRDSAIHIHVSILPRWGIFLKQQNGYLINLRVSSFFIELVGKITGNVHLNSLKYIWILMTFNFHIDTINVCMSEISTYFSIKGPVVYKFRIINGL